MSIIQFNKGLILEIVQFLQLKEIVNFLTTCKSLYEIFEIDYLYKIICKKNFIEDQLIVEQKPENITYKEYLVQNINKIKYYKKVLNKVINSYAQDPNFNYFENHQSQKFFQNDQQKLKQILKITKDAYGQIPKDVLIIFRLLNGQNELRETNNETFFTQGLFGAIQYYDIYFIYDFQSFQKPYCGYLENLKALPFSKVYPIQKTQFIDVSNKLGYGNQSIYLFGGINHNEYYFYILHQTIDSFMQKIENYNWNQEDNYLDQFDTLNNPGSDTTTAGIRIRATAKHLPQDQRNSINNFFYAYSIRISANGIPLNKKYQLQTRKWIITKDRDPQNPEIVQGEGVVGYYPTMFDGAQDFIYQSCCPMQGFSGSMKGSFTFIDLNTQELIEAKIDEFPLRPDEDFVLLKYNPQNQQKNVIYPTQIN